MTSEPPTTSATDSSDSSPRWVVVGQHDDVLDGPFENDAHAHVMAAANKQRKRDWDRIRVITVPHLRDIQDRWLDNVRFFRDASGFETKIVARTDTQFAAVQQSPDGDVRPLTVRYREFQRLKDDLTRLEESDVDGLDWDVRQELRHGLLVKSRKAQRELREQYLAGKPVDHEAAWNPLVEAAIKDSVQAASAEAE